MPERDLRLHSIYQVAQGPGSLPKGPNETTRATVAAFAIPALLAFATTAGAAESRCAAAKIKADGATAADPLETSVTSPNAGTIVITETSPTQSPPAGYAFFGRVAIVTAPAATAAVPLTLTFQIDASIVRSTESYATIQVFRDGVPVRGCVGAAGIALPDPCVVSRTALPGGDVQITVLSSHASNWNFGQPLCGNGVLDGGEACDPPAAQCSAGQFCKSTCQCSTACDCCAGSPTRLTFESVVGSGTCGTVLDNTSSPLFSLACNGAYVGGGGSAIPLPITLTDVIRFRTRVDACDPVTEQLTLGGTTAAEAGGNRYCTTAGCTFGPPQPHPNPTFVGASFCLQVAFTQSASGTASCEGSSLLTLPLAATVHLTGDLLDGSAPDRPSVPGIQPCPLCTAGTCQGGPNHNLPCTPENTTPGSAYPTSQDCPPPGGLPYVVGTLTVGMTATTGTASNTATFQSSEVFCGYCGSAFSPSFKSPPFPCDTNADCVGLTGCPGGTACDTCKQRNSGAFGTVSPNAGAEHQITVVGTPAGICLADTLAHPATLAGGFCMDPTFNATVDSFADLPGPGAASLQGTFQLQ